MLLRCHARKLCGWKCALGSPFRIPDLDDELYLHCYIKDSQNVGIHSGIPRNSEGYHRFSRDSKKEDFRRGHPERPLHREDHIDFEGPHKLTVSVPWSLQASDIALHMAVDGEKTDVVVVRDGSSAQLNNLYSYVLVRTCMLCACCRQILLWCFQLA